MELSLNLILDNWRQRVSMRLAAIHSLHVLVILIGLRVIAFMLVSPSSTSTYEFGTIGANLAAGRGYSYFSFADGTVSAQPLVGTPLPSAYMPPLYTFVVAIAYYVRNQLDLGVTAHIWIIRFVNLGLALMTGLGVSRLAREIGGRQTERLAILLYSIYPTAIYLTTQVSAANLYLCLEIWLLVGCSFLSQYRSRSLLLIVSLGFGALCLLRAEAVLLTALVVLWVLIFGNGSGRLRVATAVVFLIIAMIPPVAWSVRSSYVLNATVLTTTTTGGFNLWIGNHSGASGSQKSLETPEEIRTRISQIAATSRYEVERDQTYRLYSVDFIKSNPLEVLGKDSKKLFFQVFFDPYDARSVNLAYWSSYGVVLLVGAFGWRRWYKSADREPALLALVSGYVAISLIIPTLFFSLARYKLPLELMCLIGVALWFSDERSSSGLSTASMSTSRDISVAARDSLGE